MIYIFLSKFHYKFVMWTMLIAAFVWLKCEAEIEDCESFLRDKHKIIARSGKHFGGSSKYVRISVLPRDEIFDQFTGRLASITAS